MHENDLCLANKAQTESQTLSSVHQNFSQSNPSPKDNPEPVANTSDIIPMSIQVKTNSTDPKSSNPDFSQHSLVYSQLALAFGEGNSNEKSDIHHRGLKYFAYLKEFLKEKSGVSDCNSFRLLYAASQWLAHLEVMETEEPPRNCCLNQKKDSSSVGHFVKMSGKSSADFFEVCSQALRSGNNVENKDWQERRIFETVAFCKDWHATMLSKRKTLPNSSFWIKELIFNLPKEIIDDTNKKSGNSADGIDRNCQNVAEKALEFFNNSLYYCGIGLLEEKDMGKDICKERKRTASIISLYNQHPEDHFESKAKIINWVLQCSSLMLRNEREKEGEMHIFSNATPHTNHNENNRLRETIANRLELILFKYHSLQLKEKTVLQCVATILTNNSIESPLDIIEMKNMFSFKRSSDCSLFLDEFSIAIRKEPLLVEFFHPYQERIEAYLVLSTMPILLSTENMFVTDIESNIKDMSVKVKNINNNDSGINDEYLNGSFFANAQLNNCDTGDCGSDTKTKLLLSVLCKILLIYKEELSFSNEVLQLLWNFIIEIIQTYSVQINTQSLSPVILCSIYAILKIIKFEVKFKTITGIWREQILNETESYLTIRLLDHSNFNTISTNSYKVIDIITLFNSIFVPSFKMLLNEISEQIQKKETIRIVKYEIPIEFHFEWKVMKSSYKLNDKVTVAISPRKKQPRVRRPSFTYCFGSSIQEKDNNSEKKQFGKRLLF